MSYWLPMDTTPAIGEHVDRDVPCANCGYQLRTLHVARVCPECGQPIADSLRGDRLRWSNREWLSRIALGATLLRVGVRWGFITLVVEMALMIALAALASVWSPPFDAEWLIERAFLATLWIVASAAAVGLFLVSTPDPASRKPIEDRIIHVLSALALPIIICWVAFGRPRVGPLAPWAQFTITLPPFALVWAHMLAMTRLAQNLRKRCDPDPAERLLLSPRLRAWDSAWPVVLVCLDLFRWPARPVMLGIIVLTWGIILLCFAAWLRPVQNEWAIVRTQPKK